MSLVDDLTHLGNFRRRLSTVTFVMFRVQLSNALAKILLRISVCVWFFWTSVVDLTVFQEAEKCCINSNAKIRIKPDFTVLNFVPDDEEKWMCYNQ